MKAVLFDFFFFLVENGVFPSPVKQAKSILRLNVPFIDYIERFEKAFMTEKFDNLADSFQNVCREFRINPPNFVIDKLVGMWNKNSLLSKPFADTIETLEELKKQGIKTALIANTDPFSINQVIDKFGLAKHFDAVILSCDYGKLKSDPALFQAALGELGVSKEEALMVGDSIESDIRGAENAGISAVLIDRKDRREYENKILDMHELLDKVA